MIYQRISYDKDKEMLLDNKRTPAEVIVVPVDMRATFLDKVGQRFVAMFPKIATSYSKMLLEEKVAPGDAITFEEDGYKIVLLVGQYVSYGKNKDDEETTVFFLSNAIDNMIRKYGYDIKYVSGKIGSNKMWHEINKYIKDLGATWMVYLD